MGSGFSWLSSVPIEIALKATAFALIVIGALILFIWARRTYRSRYFARRDKRASELRQEWPRILSLEIPPAAWLDRRLDRELIESTLLDTLDVADGDERLELGCLRESGLLERYIYEARTWRGWKRQQALVRLGRTRAPEAVPALADALDSRDPEVVTAAVRALGHIASPRAMLPILDRLAEKKLVAPHVPLKHALVNGCASGPTMLLRYLDEVTPELRDLLAQVLGQIATSEMADDLAVLAGDPSPEVRAAAARALAKCRRELAIGLLFTLVLDDTWFVRLRAVASLGQLQDPRTIDVLAHSLCDSHRIVRQRAAMALVQLETESGMILETVIATHDRFALHSFVSELQRSGRYPDVLKKLRQPGGGALNLELIASAEEARRELQMRVPAATT